MSHSAPLDAIVVGSGPAGAIAALTLAEAGERDQTRDVGRTLEPDRAALAARMAARPVESWAPEDVRAAAPAGAYDPRRPKLVFGSDFPYAAPAEARLEQHGTNVLVSHARGGLSTVWGAAMLPNPSDEFDGWPVGAEDLAPHYAAVARIVGLAAEDDRLASAFPLHRAPSPAARASAQAERLLRRLRDQAEPLARRGFMFGRSRLALDTEPEGCRYAGLCLTGCPYDAVWSAERVFRRLASSSHAYAAGVEVLRLQASARGVTVLGRDRRTREPVRFAAPRVFLAAGAFSSARIAAESLGLYGRELRLLYQPYFMVPFLSRDAASGVEAERLHTLAQVFLDLRNDAVSRRWVHLQFYSYSGHIRRAVDAVLGPLSRLVPAARAALLGRLWAVQGYLHSDEGGAIGMMLRAPEDGGPATAVASAPSPQRRRATVRRVIQALWRARAELGGWPLAPLLTHGRPGDGSHVGGTFPMSSRPGPMQCDAAGMLASLPGVHLVDGSCLPSIPATTFTFTVMANARRIALAAAR